MRIIDLYCSDKCQWFVQYPSPYSSDFQTHKKPHKYDRKERPVLKSSWLNILLKNKFESNEILYLNRLQHGVALIYIYIGIPSHC